MLDPLAMAGAASGDIAHAALSIGSLYPSGTNLILGDQIFSQRILIGKCLAVDGDRISGRGRLVSHIEDLVARAKVFTLIAMATQAPLHLQRCVLIHKGHLIYRAVTGVTADALGDVNAVIEVNEIRELIDPGPLQRFAGAVAGADRLQQLGVGPNLRMAIHAGLRRGNSSKARILDRGVTVTAIDAETGNVMLMTEGDRLRLADSRISDEWRSLNCIRNPDQASNDEDSTEDTGARQRIGAAMKDLRHFSL